MSSSDLPTLCCNITNHFYSAQQRPAMVGSSHNTLADGRASYSNGYIAQDSSAKKRTADTSDTEHQLKKPRLEESTDKTRWRMKDEDGRHTWHYLEDDDAAKAWPQSQADKWYLGLPLVSLAPDFPLDPFSLHSTNTSAPLTGLAHPSQTTVTPRRRQERIDILRAAPT